MHAAPCAHAEELSPRFHASVWRSRSLLPLRRSRRAEIRSSGGRREYEHRERRIARFTRCAAAPSHVCAHGTVSHRVRTHRSVRGGGISVVVRAACVALRFSCALAGHRFRRRWAARDHATRRCVRRDVEMSRDRIQSIADHIHALRDGMKTMLQGVNVTWSTAVFDRRSHAFHAAWDACDARWLACDRCNACLA